ncbi:MAG: hypothetical protein FJ344_03295 [Sphingomonadales bacterium]|nr:hypothetical protein [Sphingomonadales bacterium]
MKSGVHNLKQIIWFRGLVFVVVAAGTLALFSDIPEALGIAIFISTLLLLVAIWVMIRPGYMAFEVNAGTIYISTDQEAQNEVFLSLPASELTGHEVIRQFSGLRRTLYLYRATDRGIMRSKGVPLGLLCPKDTRKMLDVLTEISRTNGYK